MEVAILFALILLNGVFAMSEIALVTARKARLQKHIDEGDRGAIEAVAMNQDPTRFLSTIQIGITSISILNGIVGDAVLSRPIAAWLRTRGVDDGMSEVAATAMVVVTITYFSIVLGELVPKRIGQISPETIARTVARPLHWLAVITTPFVRLLMASTALVLRLLGLKDRQAEGVTEEEIHAMLTEGSESGVIEHHEHTMVRNVFRLDDRQLGSLMVPRADIVFLDAGLPWAENVKRIEAHEHTRFPVCRGGMTEILGIATSRTLLSKTLRGEVPDLTRDLQTPVFVPESLTGMELLENFRLSGSGAQVAFVVDEYGEVLGMITFTDVIEAITGEFKPHKPGDSWAVQRDDGSWLLDGLIPIPELKDRLHIRAIPEEGRERYHTLAGMVLLLLGRLPQVGDHVDWDGWRIEIVDMDGRRIDKVLASSLPKIPTENPEDVR